jgi:hypothetical protein
MIVHLIVELIPTMPSEHPTIPQDSSKSVVYSIHIDAKEEVGCPHQY